MPAVTKSRERHIDRPGSSPDNCHEDMRECDIVIEPHTSLIGPVDRRMAIT